MRWFTWSRSRLTQQAEDEDPIAARAAARDRQRAMQQAARLQAVTFALQERLTHAALDRLRATGLTLRGDEPTMLVHAVTDGATDPEPGRWFVTAARGGTSSEDLTALLAAFAEAILDCTKQMAEVYDIGGRREIDVASVGCVDYSDFRAGVDPLIAGVYNRLAWLLTGDGDGSLTDSATTARLARRLAPGGAPLLLGPAASDAHVKLTARARALWRQIRG